MRKIESNIRRHARMGPKDRWARQKSHQLYTVLAVGFLGAALIGVPAEFYLPGWGAAFGFAGFLGALLLRGLWLSRRAVRQGQKASSLQRELHDLKQQEFELRYAEAKARGDVT